MTRPRLLFDGRAELAEGPVWHGGALWWVEITAGRLNRLDPATGMLQARALGALVSAAVPTTVEDRLLIAVPDGIEWLDWRTGTRERLHVLEADIPGNRANDGKCDPSGRFWIGTMALKAEAGAGSLYRFDGTGPPKAVLGDLKISNGMAWNREGTVFYFIDTPTQRIDRFDYDPSTGAISGRAPLRRFDTGDGYPDGMAIDDSDNLWVAMWGGGAVLCIDGRSGETKDRIEIPVSQPTSCCFGGEDGSELFITTAWQGLDAPQRETEPQAGGIYSCSPGVTGQAARPYRSPQPK